MMIGHSTFNGRIYALTAYTALTLAIIYILYFLDTAGLTINLTYNEPHQLPPSPKPDFPEFEIKNKVAVIIESRALSSLTPLLAHFSSVLGPSWPIVLFTLPTSEIPTSPPFKRLVTSRRLDVRYLPEDLKFKNRQDVSNFLAKPWLYDQLAPAEHILFFQSDSMICARSEATVDDFLQYDFIGAPIDKKFGHGFNGGLSLRNRTMLLDIIHSYQLEKERNDRNGTKTQGIGFEDQWFYKKMLNETHGNLPTMEVAQRFAVETIWYDKPLGYHQVQRWQKARLKEVDEWCPENRLVVGKAIAN